MPLSLDLMLALQDDDFQKIINSDQVIAELEKQKYNPSLQFNQLMAIISKIYKIKDVFIQVITPAIWAFLYCIGNAYTKKDKEIEKADTDVFMYILSHGISNLPQDLFLQSAGFCTKNNLDYEETKQELKNLIYLMFRPLQMFNTYLVNSAEEVRFNGDWLTRIVSTVSPLTGKSSNQIMFQMSLTECFYYMIQSARKYDTKNIIKRKNSAEIEAEIYQRMIQLGKQYYAKNYEGGKR